MTLKNANIGGAIPLPLRGVFGRYNGTLGAPARGFEPGVLDGNPVGVALSLLVKDSWTAPVTASTTAYISTGLTGAGEMPNNSTITCNRTSGSLTAEWNGTYGATGKPDYPRNVVVTVTHASSVVACNGVITGKDRYGRQITETWSVTATGTSKTYTSVTSFYQVDEITVISASDATANTLKLGFGAVLGLSMPCSVASAVKEVAAGSVVTNGVFVARSTAANADKRGTYAPNTPPNSSNDYTVWYISDDPSLL